MLDPKTIDLNLLVMYLNCWKEESREFPGGIIFRTWNGYLQEVLDTLTNDRLIFQIRDSVIFTEDGKHRAERLKRLYY